MAELSRSPGRFAISEANACAVKLIAIVIYSTATKIISDQQQITNVPTICEYSKSRKE